MSILIRKLQKAWNRHGLLGTFRHGARKLVQVLHGQMPAQRRARDHV